MLRARDSRLEAPVRSPGSRQRRTVVGRQQVLHSLLRGPRHLGGILPGELAGLDRIRDQLVHLGGEPGFAERAGEEDRKSTRLNSSHVASSYAVFCLNKKI